MPLLGMAVGAAAGGAAGALSDVRINDQFMKDLGAKLTPCERDVTGRKA